MVHNMYKSKRQLSDADTLELLKKGDHGTLAVQGDDGYPYATPVNYILVGTSSTSTPPLRVQDQCLQRDPKCCFTAILNWRSSLEDHCVL